MFPVRVVAMVVDTAHIVAFEGALDLVVVIIVALVVLAATGNIVVVLLIIAAAVAVTIVKVIWFAVAVAISSWPWSLF